jgi:hypothetical protein
MFPTFRSNVLPQRTVNTEGVCSSEEAGSLFFLQYDEAQGREEGRPIIYFGSFIKCV